MPRTSVVSLAAALALGIGSVALIGIAHADNFWDMMDPEWWFGDDDDDWEYWAYGPGSHFYAGGPYGWGWGGYPGYYAYGAPPRTQAAKEKAPPLPLPE